MTDPEAVLAEFERAWRAGGPPPELPAAADPATYRELVLLDLEYRWRRYAAAAHDWLGPEVPPRLEEYAARPPGLAVDADLAGEEFRARHVWGDRPAAAEYAARFPPLAAELARTLPALLAEMTSEVPAPPAARPDPPAPPAAEPTTLGPYRLVARLGGGGLGVVYRGEHADTGAAVAVKVLRPDLLADREAVARLDREARLLAALDHPNLVRLVGVERGGGRVGLVMELVAGRTLLDRVRADGPPPPAEAVRVMGEVLTALAFIHGRGLVHRDVTPANLMTDAAGRTRLLDLGLAKVRADHARAAPPTRTRSSWITPQGVGVLGTPEYLAPELARGAAATPAADLYAAGCVAHFLATGAPPFAGGPAFRTLVRHATEPPPPLPPGHPLAGLAARLLAKAPADRPTAAAARAGLDHPTPTGGPPHPCVENTPANRGGHDWP